MSLENNIRILLFVFGIYAALYGPWWLPAVPIALVSLRFRAWETMILGLFIDLLWLPAGVHIPLYTITAIALVWAFEPLRKELLLT